MIDNENGAAVAFATPIESSQHKDNEISWVDEVAGEVNKTKVLQLPKVETGVSKILNKKESEILHERQKVFVPTWNNKPKEVPAVLSLSGTPILTNQNTSSIIAPPGMGKSSLCESIASSYLNPNADNLGFEVSQDCKGILIIDNERTDTDVWNSFSRMCRRANIPYGSEIKNVKIAGLRAIPRLKERTETIKQLLDENLYSLLLIDGAGDLVTDSNDLLQAIDCRIFLRELTISYNLSILTTLHPNPNTNKPRGHIGSEIYRESECVLLAKSLDGDIRVLTSDFEHGKNRNNSKITSAYKWSEEQNMFVTVDTDCISLSTGRENVNKIKNQVELLSYRILQAPKALTHTDLQKQIQEAEDCSEPTAKRRIKAMIEFGFIKKHDDGYYRAVM